MNDNDMLTIAGPVLIVLGFTYWYRIIFPALRFRKMQKKEYDRTGKNGEFLLSNTPFAFDYFLAILLTLAGTVCLAHSGLTYFE